MSHISFSGSTPTTDDVMADLSDPETAEDDATANQGGVDDGAIDEPNGDGDDNDGDDDGDGAIDDGDDNGDGAVTDTPPARRHGGGGGGHQDRSGGGSGDNSALHKQKKTKWVRLKKQFRGREVYPFLEDHRNAQDPALIRRVVAEEPFRASYGMVESSWSELAASLSAEVNEEDGTPIFPFGVSHRVCQDRFNAIMKWYETTKDKIDLDAYDENDEHDTETLERLHLVREAHEITSAHDAEKKKEEHPYRIRDTSGGGTGGGSSTTTTGEDGVAHPRREAARRREHQAVRTTLLSEKGAYKRRKLELMKRRIDNDSDVIAMKRARQEARREERQQRLQLELEERRMSMKMQESLIKLIERMADK